MSRLLYLWTRAVSNSSQEQQLNRAALRQQDVVTQLGTTPDRAEDLLMRINNAASAEELTQIIYSQQQ